MYIHTAFMKLKIYLVCYLFIIVGPDTDGNNNNIYIITNKILILIITIFYLLL